MPNFKQFCAKIETDDSERSITAVIADTVYELYKGGFLNAFSVGFQPNSFKQPTPKEIEKNPELAEANRIFDDWDLLEFSAVPVPANPDALATAVKSKSIELSEKLINELGVELKEPEPEIEPEPEPIEFAEPITIETKEAVKLSRVIVTDPVEIPKKDKKLEVKLVMKRLKGQVY